MATILTGDLTRETTIKVEEREIQLTLTAEQKITMKLKGMKSGTVEIGIGELYHQLTGSTSSSGETETVNVVERPIAGRLDLSSYKGEENLVISLTDLRAAAIVHGFDLDMTTKLDGFLAQLIVARKKT